MTGFGDQLRREAEQPREKILSLEQCVDCSCDPWLSVPVFGYNMYSEYHVAACLRCGRLSNYVPRGDEPRSAGPARGANFLRGMPAALCAWLEGWPRQLTLGPTSVRPVWSPATTRIATREEFQEIRERELERQHRTPAAQRFREFTIPQAPPPAEALAPSTARDFLMYVHVHAAYYNSDPDALVKLFRQRNWDA